MQSTTPYSSGRSRLFRALIVAGFAALTGIVSAVSMPHGPATSTQALLVMAAGLAAGAAAGLVLRSRWAILLAPAAHVAALEIARIGVIGPSVGAPRFDLTLGILAFIAGRGLYGLLCLAPMMLGAGVGAAYAKRHDAAKRPFGRVSAALRWLPAAVVSAGLIALAVAIARPASTPPILGADGKPLPGSIAELTRVRLGGHDQAVLIRGQNVDNPVLLYLSGGPGQSDMALPRFIFAELEKDVTIVCWDQRGTGKSYAALDPTSTWTPEQAVADTVELTNYLRARFKQDKIYLLGESWGTALGVLAVQQHPELYYAFIGSGQMVSIKETDRRLYHDLLDYAARTGDTKLAAQMQAFGEPPYKDMYVYGFVMGLYDKLTKPYTAPAAYTERRAASGVGPLNNLGSEYDLIEKVNAVRGLLDMASVLYPQLQGIDFRQDVLRLEVPVYILDGGSELSARRDLAHEWFAQLQAPSKQMFTFEDAGHAVAFEEFEAFDRIMTGTILPKTYGQR